MRTGDAAGSRRHARRRWSSCRGSRRAPGVGAAVVGAGLRCERRTRRGPPTILLRRRGNDTPAGTGRSLRSARSSRSSRQVSRPGRVSTRGRMSPPKDGTGGPGPVVGSTPRVRRQRAWRLRVACSRPRPGSAGPSSVAGTSGGPGSGNAPGGHVSLIGAATFTGAPGSPAAPSGGAPSGGGGAAGSPPSGGHQSGRSRRVHRREHGELCGVVGHDAREPDRVPPSRPRHRPPVP